MRRSLPPLSVAFGALLLATGPALAQSDAGGERPSARPLAQGVEVRIDGARSQGVDESGLRYYVSRGEQAMVEAEIRRLRQMYPGWEPPADLFGEASDVDERPLWELYEAGDYEGVRSLIASLEQQHPDWSPPRQLLDLMETNETRAQLQAFESEGRWSEIVALAEARPDQVGCDAIDNGWRLARAHAELGNEQAAFEVYARQIRSCDTFDHRLATLQKARAQLGDERVETLFELERGRAKSETEQEQIATLEAETFRPAPEPAPFRHLFEADVTLTEAEAAEDAVLESQDAPAAERLGWIYYGAGDFERAAVWFARALGFEPNAKRAEGLALSLQQSGQLGALEMLATRYPDIAGPILGRTRGSELVRAFEDGDYATVLEITRSSDGLPPGEFMLRGWSLLSLDRPTEAEITFEQVIEDPDTDLATRREAAYGLARTALAIGNRGRALQIADAFMISQERRFELHAEVMQAWAVEAFADKDYRTALALLEARRSYADPPRDLQILEAWSRYHLGQKTVAARMFTRLHRVYATPETEAALRVLEDRIEVF